MKEKIMDRTILHLDADAFFASVEKGFNPLLKEKPVIVGGLPHQRGCVHTGSYEARRMGVYTGMSLRQAQEICPDAVFLKGDYRQYRAAGLVIERILNNYSPDIELASVDDAYVDLTHVLHLYESAGFIAENIQRDIRTELKIGVSVGVASSKLVARIASGLFKPEGVTVVPAGQEQVFLAGLPLRELRGIGRKTEEIFHDLGITTIGGIADLPQTTVMQILGPVIGGMIWKYANGSDNRNIKEKSIPGQISRETSFEEDTDDQKLIIGTLRYLTERIAAKLREKELTAKRVFLKVRYADRRSQKQWLTLKQKTDDRDILTAGVYALHNGFSNRRVRVKLVGITVSNIERKNDQGMIFDLTGRSDGLNMSIDNVRKRFGFMSVSPGSTLALQNYYRMEKHGYILHTPSLSQ